MALPPELALLSAAAVIGILHMSAPDHWATLVMLGRASKWSRSELVGVGVMTGLGHVALSALLGLLIAGVGLLFSQQVSVYITEAIGLIMFVGGVAYGLVELRTHSEAVSSGETQAAHAKGEGTLGKRFSYFAVLGAALSPDLAILPIFLLAVPIGWPFALATAAVFGFASVAALLVFLILGMEGLARVFERIPPKYNNALVGFVVAAVGAYILVVG